MLHQRCHTLGRDSRRFTLLVGYAFPGQNGELGQFGDQGRRAFAGGSGVGARDFGRGMASGHDQRGGGRTHLQAHARSQRDPVRLTREIKFDHEKPRLGDQ